MKTMTNPKEMMTPWGVAQTHEELAPGVEGLYRLGGSCSDGNGVAQQFCRYPDGHAIVRHFKSYWDVAGIKNVYGWFTREEVLTFGA